MVVGASGATIGSNQYQGAVYVYVEPSGGWVNSTETAKLTTSNGESYSFFGESVSISETTVGAGGGNPTNGTSGGGAAYVFVEPAGGWQSTSTFNAKLTPSDGGAYDFFGDSVVIDGSTIVAGSTATAEVYVFVRPAEGWVVDMTETAKLTAVGTRTREFAFSVSISGKTVVVGAPYSSFRDYDQGAAYVFVEPQGGWTSTSAFDAQLIASDPRDNAVLGWSVSVSGSSVLAGADGTQDGGTCYLFVEPKGGWKNGEQTAEFHGTAAGALGVAVAASGNTVLCGAPDTSIGANPRQGAAYVFGQ